MCNSDAGAGRKEVVAVSTAAVTDSAGHCGTVHVIWWSSLTADGALDLQFCTARLPSRGRRSSRPSAVIVNVTESPRNRHGRPYQRPPVADFKADALAQLVCAIGPGRAAVTSHRGRPPCRCTLITGKSGAG